MKTTDLFGLRTSVSGRGVWICAASTRDLDLAVLAQWLGRNTLRKSIKFLTTQNFLHLERVREPIV